MLKNFKVDNIIMSNLKIEKFKIPGQLCSSLLSPQSFILLQTRFLGIHFVLLQVNSESLQTDAIKILKII